jgi:hypothetical protein
LKAFTDYPFLHLGDKSGEKAPIRECEIISYDDNKYCEIIVDSTGASVKAGYLYTEAGRCGDVPTINVEEL